MKKIKRNTKARKLGVPKSLQVGQRYSVFGPDKAYGKLGARFRTTTTTTTTTTELMLAFGDDELAFGEDELTFG